MPRIPQTGYLFGRSSSDAVLIKRIDRGKTTLSIDATLLSARNHPKHFGNGNQTKCGQLLIGTTDRLGHKLRPVHFGASLGQQTEDFWTIVLFRTSSVCRWCAEATIMSMCLRGGSFLRQRINLPGGIETTGGRGIGADSQAVPTVGYPLARCPKVVRRTARKPS